MKKVLFILTAAVIGLVSCNKELNNETVNPINTKDGVVELLVSAPKLSDVDTKATIADADGTFTWTAGDEIAVKNDAGTVYKFIAQAAGSEVRFASEGAVTGTLESVVYPYTADATVSALPTSITGLNGALQADAIRLQGTIEGGAVTMNYVNAFLKVTFKDVPVFAKSIKVTSTTPAQDVEVTGISLAARGASDVVAYIPVAAGTYGFTVSLMDDNSNPILEKGTTSDKTFTAGSLLRMKALTVEGHILAFTNDTDWVDSSHEVALYLQDGGRYNNRWFAPSEVKQLSDGRYYVIVNKSVESWMGEGANISVKFQLEPYVDGKTAETSCIMLHRDVDFTVTSTGLKADYRVYVWLREGQRTYWDANPVQIKETENGTVLSGQVDMAEIVGDGGSSFYYEVSSTHFGKQVTFVTFNKSNEAWNATTGSYYLYQDQWTTADL